MTRFVKRNPALYRNFPNISAPHFPAGCDKVMQQAVALFVAYDRLVVS